MQSSLVVHFLLLILASLSYDQLAKPPSVEARRLNSNGGSSFTVELIHRDSPNSPYYNPSKPANVLGSISRNHKFQLPSTYYSNKDVKNLDTNLIPNGGDYLMKIAIGTPPVEFIGIADTGSDLVWVQCSPCKPCIPQHSSLFDPTKSSTYQAIPCHSQSCTPADLYSGCLKNDPNCVYDYLYGDATESVGHLAKETITFTSADGASVPFPNSTFGCGYDQKGSFGIQGDGIFGLGSGPSSLISQLGPNINYKFSYCLNPLSSGVNSKLKFGADVSGPRVVSTPFTTNATDDTLYRLTLNGITIGDNAAIPTAGHDIIIDSGTTLTFLESKVYENVVNTLKCAIQVSPVPDPYNMSDLCYATQQQSGSTAGDQGFNPPDVVFHFEGADVELKSINIFRPRPNGLVACLAMMPTKLQPIFGNIAQVNFEVGYDLQAKKVSFAPADCTTY